jgi:PAP2 superfamily/ABC-2 family transporter protein
VKVLSRPPVLDGPHRVAVAAALLFREVFRRRFALVLLFVVPALFDTVVLLTTTSRQLRVTVASLREDLADATASTGTLFDLGVIDDGVREVNQRQLSLVFLGHAAVCFLACFLAFNLVARHREVDRRLVLAGYRTAEVLTAKLAVLGLIVVLLVCWQTALIRPWVSPHQPGVFVLGLLLGGLSYGALGFLIGAAVRQELEGIFLIVLLTNVDPGWLQNPIYFAQSQHPQLITSLPAFASTQLTVLGALLDERPEGLVARGALYCAATLLVAVTVFGLRIRPSRLLRRQPKQERLHFARMLLLGYAVWMIGFQLVGRYAATLRTWDLTTAWDRAIPFVPAFVWPYEACYALPVIALWLFRDWHRFNVGFLAIAIASLFAFAAYLLLPVAFPRPALGSSLSERLLATEFAADFSPGANKLPSLHVAISWIILFAIWGQAKRRVTDLLVLVLVAAITVSTLFVKQHLVLDVVTAVPLAVLAFAIAHRLYWRVTGPGDRAEQALAQLLTPANRHRMPEGPPS